METTLEIYKHLSLNSHLFGPPEAVVAEAHDPGDGRWVQLLCKC